jgi:hypothetical protein
MNNDLHSYLRLSLQRLACVIQSSQNLWGSLFVPFLIPEEPGSHLERKIQQSEK